MLNLPPKPITDAEVERYIAVQRTLDATLLAWRKRVADGAPVEVLEFELRIEPITAQEHETLRTSPDGGLSAEGVTITGLPLSELPALPEHRLEVLHAMLQAMDAYRGCTTPIEEFLLDLVRDYGIGVSMTPDCVRESLKQFDSNFFDAISDAKLLVRRYPYLFEEAIRSNDEYAILLNKAPATLSSNPGMSSEQGDGH